jgi:hypothetical protein
MWFLVKNFPAEKEVWDGTLSRCNSQFICRENLGRPKFSHIFTLSL